MTVARSPPDWRESPQAPRDVPRSEWPVSTSNRSPATTRSSTWPTASKNRTTSATAYQVNVVATRALLEQANRVGDRPAHPHVQRERARRGGLRYRQAALRGQLSRRGPEPRQLLLLSQGAARTSGQLALGQCPQREHETGRGATLLRSRRAFRQLGPQGTAREASALPRARHAPSISSCGTQTSCDAYATILTNGLSGIYNVAPTDQTSVRGDQLDHRSTTDLRPVASFEIGADLLFRLRLAPFSGHWVTLGDPLLDSQLLRSTTNWDLLSVLPRHCGNISVLAAPVPFDHKLIHDQPDQGIPEWTAPVSKRDCLT